MQQRIQGAFEIYTSTRRDRIDRGALQQLASTNMQLEKAFLWISLYGIGVDDDILAYVIGIIGSFSVCCVLKRILADGS